VSNSKKGTREKKGHRYFGVDAKVAQHKKAQALPQADRKEASLALIPTQKDPRGRKRKENHNELIQGEDQESVENKACGRR